jgi:hypothetical protein
VAVKERHHLCDAEHEHEVEEQFDERDLLIGG